MYLQTSTTQIGIFAMMTIIPAVTNLVSIVPFLFYKLSGKKLQSIREDLEKRRAEKEQAELA